MLESEELVTHSTNYAIVKNIFTELFTKEDIVSSLSLVTRTWARNEDEINMPSRWVSDLVILQLSC